MLEDIPVQAPAAGGVPVEVLVAGINDPDLLIIENKYQIKAPLPFSPNGEFVGVVLANGPSSLQFYHDDTLIGFTG